MLYTSLAPGGCHTYAVGKVEPQGAYNITMGFSYQIPLSENRIEPLAGLNHDITFLHYWAADDPTMDPKDAFPNCTIPAYANATVLQPHVIQRYLNPTFTFARTDSNESRTIVETVTYTIGCGDFGFAANGSFYVQLWSQSVVNKNESGSWSQPNVMLNVSQTKFDFQLSAGKVGYGGNLEVERRASCPSKTPASSAAPSSFVAWKGPFVIFSCLLMLFAS
ncbi:Aste57867_3329 [Aphanomyces stellatus]|uniref:Aste57867_3327 protein n=1 Tax=Aphanomyces stellatus TaxID=120398 RepID=A0A485KA76_9STRA|nr:hypothetical protein As57867_003317 [Aphanomyces stellatus]KAF0715536.1 hypothetical protein As57867_003319 [Aphanomyces stellatus]VFT80497.1 Aste57867_3327 [Aphanomyces stellatus]VFT80499.1 Aste57867_3329 [Aphanomyces stellatus]